MPLNSGLPRAGPSDIMISDSPMRIVMCMIFFSDPGGIIPGGGGSGDSSTRICISTVAPSAFT